MFVCWISLEKVKHCICDVDFISLYSRRLLLRPFGGRRDKRTTLCTQENFSARRRGEAPVRSGNQRDGELALRIRVVERVLQKLLGKHENITQFRAATKCAVCMPAVAHARAQASCFQAASNRVPDSDGALRRRQLDSANSRASAEQDALL